MKGRTMKQDVISVKIKKFFTLCGLFLVGAAVLLPAHQSRAGESDELRIGVMPFIKGKNPENVEETITCPYSSFCFEDESIRPNADQQLTDMLQAILNRDFKGRVIPLGKSADAFEVLKIDHAKDTPMTIVIEIGKMLEADYMMAGNVWRYTDRIGTSFSAEKPASVAFAVYLVEVKTGKLVWKDSYDKTQQALTENLFNVKDFFKQGAKWLRAEELAEFGMNKLFEHFPLK